MQENKAKYETNENTNKFHDQLPFKLENFYKHKKQALLFNVKLCSLHIVERMYLIIMLFNSEVSSGVFSLLYLSLAAYMWYNAPRK
jgi:hypothetical protein